MAVSFLSRTVTAADGLMLHARDYGRAEPGAPTVLCLSGLARTAADFDPLALHLLADHPERRVVAPDYRGRGGSGRDPDPDRYDLPVESADILAVCDALGVDPAVVVGTSRGGLHAMVLAAVRPALLAGVVLNDIGPVIEAKGLERIRGYVGKLPSPSSWDHAVELLRGVAGHHFTGLADDDWLRYAQTTFEEQDGAFRTRYDPALMRNLAKLDLSAVPTLWPQFDALAAVPVMVLRGENSDLLSPGTVAAMAARHPNLDTLTVPGQGHAPLLTDAPTLGEIAGFVDRCLCRDAASAAAGLSLLP